MNGKPIMLLSQADLDEGDDLTLDQAAQRVFARMEAQRTSLREQYNTRYLLLAALKSAVGALLLALVCYLAFRSWRRVRRFFHLRILEKRSLIPHSWRRFLGNIESRLYALLVILLGILAGYIWLSWVFSLFPWTRVWGESLGEWSVGVIRDISLSIVSALPGVCRSPVCIRKLSAPRESLSPWLSGSLRSPPPILSCLAQTLWPSRGLACSSA